jgi:hypothetical protein
MSDPERIWLQNADDARAIGEGRLWCEDKVWPECPEQNEPTEYVRADLHAKLERELAEAREFRAILEGHLAAAIDDYNDARRQAFEDAAQITLIFAGKHEPSYGIVNNEIHQAILAVVTAIRAKAQPHSETRQEQR